MLYIAKHATQNKPVAITVFGAINTPPITPAVITIERTIFRGLDISSFDGKGIEQCRR